MKTWRNGIVCTDKDKFELGEIWSSNDNLRQISLELVDLLLPYPYETIIGIETKGLLLASGISVITGHPLVVMRKKSRIRYTKDIKSIGFNNWRNESDGLEVPKAIFEKYHSAVVIDDICYSEASFRAMKELWLDKIVAFACISNLSGHDNIGAVPVLSLV